MASLLSLSFQLLTTVYSVIPWVAIIASTCQWLKDTDSISANRFINWSQNDVINLLFPEFNLFLGWRNHPKISFFEFFNRRTKKCWIFQLKLFNLAFEVRIKTLVSDSEGLYSFSRYKTQGIEILQSKVKLI